MNAARVINALDFADVPGAVDCTVLASTTDDEGRNWLVIEERRLSILLVDADVAEGSEHILSPQWAGRQ